MTTDTDTAAALEAAIDAIACRRCDSDDPIGSTDRSALHRAITAHVEAEVARRLAPNLELWRWKCHDETIEQAIERLVRERNEYAEKLCERNAALVMAPDVEVAIVDYAHAAQSDFDTHEEREALRAAIAADKARAVEAGSRVDVRLLRDALRYVTAWGCVPGGSEEWKARNQDRVEDELRAAIKRGLDGGDAQARPTPDEARRLVDEYDRATRNSYVTGGPEALRAARTALVAAIAPQPQPPAASEARRLIEALHLDLLATADTVAALHGAVGTGLRSHCVAAADKLRLTATDARTALLRALGVEP